MENEVEHRLQLIQEGRLKHGWIFMNQIRAQRTEAEIELAEQENKFASLLLERKDFERQLEAIKYHKGRHLELLYSQYERIRIEHEKTELSLQFLKHDYERICRESEHVERQMEAIESVLEVAASKGLDLETYKYDEKKKIKIRSKLTLLTAKTEHELKLLDAKLSRDLQKLDKQSQIEIATIVAQTDQQLRIIQEQHRQAIELMQVQSKLRIDEENAAFKRKIGEWYAREKLDAEKRRVQIEQDHEAADRVELSPTIIRGKKSELLTKAYEDRRKIEKFEADPVLKQQKLTNISAHIQRLEVELYGEGYGLVLSEDRQEAQRHLSSSNGGTGNRKKNKRTKKQPPDKDDGLGGRW